MPQFEFQLRVESTDERTESDQANSLLNELRETDGVESVGRAKIGNETMDLGSVVTVVATSTATLAVARGIAEWLRRTRGAKLRIELKSNSESIKAYIENIDPESAVRIAEIVRGK